MERHAIEFFENVIQQIKEEQELNEESIHVLHSFFGNQLFESIHLAENEAVTKVSCESRRFIYNISDHCLYPVNKQDEYKRDIVFCTTEPRYCSCTTFLDKVICNQEIILCRHVLAAIFSEVLNSYQTNIIDDITFAEEYYKLGVL